MVIGQVSFYKDHLVKRVHVAARENAVINRLNKTKQEIQIDHEAELVKRQKAESAAKKSALEATRLAKKELEAKKKKEKEERSYDRLFSEEAMEEARNAHPTEEDDDFFMFGFHLDL